MNSTDLFVFALFFVVWFFFGFVFVFVCLLFIFFFLEGGGRVPELLPDLATPGAGKLNFSSHVFL